MKRDVWALELAKRWIMGGKEVGRGFIYESLLLTKKKNAECPPRLSSAIELSEEGQRQFSDFREHQHESAISILAFTNWEKQNKPSRKKIKNSQKKTRWRKSGSREGENERVLILEKIMKEEGRGNENGGKRRVRTKTGGGMCK